MVQHLVTPTHPEKVARHPVSETRSLPVVGILFSLRANLGQALPGLLFCGGTLVTFRGYGTNRFSIFEFNFMLEGTVPSPCFSKESYFFVCIRDLWGIRFQSPVLAGRGSPVSTLEGPAPPEKRRRGARRENHEIQTPPRGEGGVLKRSVRDFGSSARRTKRHFPVRSTPLIARQQTKRRTRTAAFVFQDTPSRNLDRSRSRLKGII